MVGGEAGRRTYSVRNRIALGVGARCNPTDGPRSGSGQCARAVTGATGPINTTHGSWRVWRESTWALLNPVELRGAAEQADLFVVRARAVLVETRTMLINFTRGITKTLGRRLPASVSHRGAGGARSGAAAVAGRARGNHRANRNITTPPSKHWPNIGIRKRDG